MKKNPIHWNLLQSASFFLAISFLTGLGNFGFQAIIGRQLKESGQFGLTNTTLGFVQLLGLPMSFAIHRGYALHRAIPFSAAMTRDCKSVRRLRKFLFHLTHRRPHSAVLFGNREDFFIPARLDAGSTLLRV